MNGFEAFIIGVVEGITEFLPISSTGHMILANHLLGVSQSEFVKSFQIIIQLGAISAVIILFWKKLWNWDNIKKLIVAFIPTGIIGLALYKVVKTYLLGSTSVVLWALLFGGIAIIIFEKFHKSKLEDSGQGIADISYKQAFLVGIFQSLAIIPGVSRSAGTIIGGLSLDISRVAIVEFSFLLAVPTMLSATGLDLLKSYSNFSKGDFSILAIGFITAFVVAVFSIKFLLNFVKNKSFSIFGYYRIVLAIVFLLIFKLY